MAPGAINKFGSHMFESKAFHEQMHCIEKSTCDVVGTFRRNPVIWRPGYCAHLSPLDAPLIHITHMYGSETWPTYMRQEEN